MDLDLKDLKGVGPSTAEKLRKAGYTSLHIVAVSPPWEIAGKVGVGIETARKMAEEARVLLDFEMITAKQLYERVRESRSLDTGSRNINELLGGGVQTQSITELVGEYGVGKSQICMQLSALVQLPEGEGGLNGKALFMDTEGTFSPRRVYEIAEARGLNPEETLENIMYARCYNSDHQMLLAEKAFQIVERENVKLVVVDSLISHFRGEYIGRENLAARQQKLNKYLHSLLRLAEIYNLAVVVTNQIQSNPNAFFGNPDRPAGGNIVAHASTHRVWLRKGKSNTRVAKIIDSPYLPEKEVSFRITEKGVEDP